MQNVIDFTFLGKEESTVDKLRSVLSQLEFSATTKDWERKSVNFSRHLYVPEKHPVTGENFCEIEDDGHVFKVCAHSYACTCTCTFFLVNFLVCFTLCSKRLPVGLFIQSHNTIDLFR